MTRTLVISDLHLGSRLGRDVLRRSVALDALLGALRDVDRLVLLGDVVEMLEGRAAKALAVARPVLRAVGGAVDEIVLVPGNHDHALIRPWLRSRRAELGLATRVSVRSEARLNAVVDALAPARVEVRYPGVWLGDGIWATHGHYLDRHLLPEIGRRTARPSDYEPPVDSRLLSLTDVALPEVIGAPLDVAAQIGARVAALGVPIAARLTRGGLAPLSAGVSATSSAAPACRRWLVS